MMKKKRRYIILVLSTLAVLLLIALGIIGYQMGFHEFFVRSQNQIAFSFYGKTVNPHVIKGEKHELYLKACLDEVTGNQLLWSYSDTEAAKADAQKNVEATLALIDTLHQHGTKFLFVFCPTKPAVYPEYLPKSYRDNLSDFSLAEYYIELFQEKDIPHIDFYHHFQNIKGSFPYPLYTRTGSHWAESTIPFVADSILRKLETISDYRFPSISIIDLNLTNDYSIQDIELEPGLNLLFPLSKPKVPRPIFALNDTIGKDRPNLLVVGDGYFTQFCHSCFVDAFNRWDFWMYNRDIYSSRPKYHWKHLDMIFDAAQVLEEADIVLVIYTSNYLYKYMNGFVQSAQELYQNGCTGDQEAIAIIIERIKNNPEWFQAIEQQAKERGLTTEENLYENAEYVLKNQ